MCLTLPPDENARPAPVMTNAPIVGSALIHAMVCSMSSTSFVPVNSLRTSSRSRTSVATPSATSTRASTRSGGDAMMGSFGAQQDACVENCQSRRIGENGIEIQFDDLGEGGAQVGNGKHELHQRGLVGWLGAAHAVEYLCRADFGKHRFRVGLGKRERPEDDVLQHFDEYAAKTEHQYRAVSRIAYDSDDDFDAALLRHRRE